MSPLPQRASEAGKSSSKRKKNLGLMGVWANTSQRVIATSLLRKWDLEGLEFEEKGQGGGRCVGQDANIGITGVPGAVSKPTGLKQRLCQPSLPIVMRMAQKGTGAGLRRLGK